MDGIDTNPLKVDEVIETVVVPDDDKNLLIRYEDLKTQKSLLMQEFDTISTHFKGNTEAANVSFVTSDGMVLAKKSTIAAKSLDRDAMVEAGVPVDKFFTTKPQARFTTTKALSKLVAQKVQNQESNSTEAFLGTLLDLVQSDTAPDPAASADSWAQEAVSVVS